MSTIYHYTFIIGKLDNFNDKRNFLNKSINEGRDELSICREIFPEMEKMKKQIFYIERENSKYVQKFLYYLIVPRFFHCISKNFIDAILEPESFVEIVLTEKILSALRRDFFCHFPRKDFFTIFICIAGEQFQEKIAYIRKVLEEIESEEDDLPDHGDLEGVTVKSFIAGDNLRDIFIFCDFLAIPHEEHLSYSRKFYLKMRNHMRKIYN